MKKEQTYTVNWIRNGWCYRTTVCVPKHAIKEMRELAKSLGEKLKIKKD